MPLIEVNQSRYVSATIRLDSATATLIDQYAAFVHGSADDVVDKALNYVFAKDREFQEYLKSPQAAKVVPSLRVRRAGTGDVPEPCGQRQEARGGVETRRAAACEKASVGTRRVPFGASHRLYLDTPPLKGYCRGTLVPRCELDQFSER